MYHDLLNIIRERSKAYADSLQPPCSAESLDNLRARATKKLGHDVPQGYAEFLALTNGLDWNGLVVYASDRTPIVGYSDRFIEGFVEGNLDFRDFEPMRGFLVFAEDGVVLFTYSLSEVEFQVVTTVGLTALERFATFEELLTNAFQAHL